MEPSVRSRDRLVCSASFPQTWNAVQRQTGVRGDARAELSERRKGHRFCRDAVARQLVQEGSQLMSAAATNGLRALMTKSLMIFWTSPSVLARLSDVATCPVAGPTIRRNPVRAVEALPDDQRCQWAAEPSIALSRPSAALRASGPSRRVPAGHESGSPAGKTARPKRQILVLRGRATSMSKKKRHKRFARGASISRLSHDQPSSDFATTSRCTGALPRFASPASARR